MIQLQSLTPLDYALCTRAELAELSDAAFDVSGHANAELESRVGLQLPRLDYEVN